MSKWVLLVLLLLSVAIQGHGAGTGSVQVQAYGAGYDTHLHMLQEIRDELRGLRADMLSAQPDRPAADGAALLAQRCASCHSPARAEDRGNGFVIAADALSVNDRRKMAGKVSRGEMPPGRGLPAGERKAIVDFLTGKTQPRK